jgi:hypothetical protein
MPETLLKKESPLDKLKYQERWSPFFYIAFFVFVIVLAVWGGLAGLNYSLEKRRTDFSEQTQLKIQSLDQGLIDQIFTLERRINNIRALLNAHVFLSNVFRLLEGDTHPKVRFSNFSVSAATNKIDLSGETESYAVLARQIAIFEGNPQVENVEFGGLSFSGNLLGFKMTIIFRPSLLQIRPAASSQKGPTFFQVRNTPFLLE